MYFGLSRYWFNKAVDYLSKEGTKAYLLEVRKIQKEDHPEWAYECPQRVREHALSDAVNAVKNAKKKEGYHKVSFKSKKNPTQSFGFDKISLKDSFVFSRKNQRVNFNPREEYDVELEGTEIKKENDRFFLIVPRNVAIKKPENKRLDCVSLDPGIRTFQTIFNPYVQGKIGNTDFSRIFRLCLHMDNLISKKSKMLSKQRQKVNKALKKLRWKIKDLIDELHKKTASFLVTNFDKILLPIFETSQMVTKLKSKVARSMLNFAHYRFQQFLINKAEEYSCEVVLVSEAYTSKTCSYCGRIQNIGSRKTMKCSCGVTEDRDINGARGIYLKALSVSTS